MKQWIVRRTRDYDIVNVLSKCHDSARQGEICERWPRCEKEIQAVHDDNSLGFMPVIFSMLSIAADKIFEVLRVAKVERDYICILLLRVW